MQIIKSKLGNICKGKMSMTFGFSRPIIKDRFLNF